jgi:predicted alpha-1,2-mannosidase
LLEHDLRADTPMARRGTRRLVLTTKHILIAIAIGTIIASTPFSNLGLRSTVMLRFILLIILPAHVMVAQPLTMHVNPFIGTANGGNTFPGAVRPWGMVSVSPHNTTGSPSGYAYGERNFYGFGHVHLSGTGCTDLGSIIVTASRGDIQTDPKHYRCTVTDEIASPGFYRALLIEPDAIAEATVTTRAGITRFTTLQDGALNVLIDVGRSLSLLGGGAVTVRSDTAVEGYNIGGGFCGENNRHRVFFAATFNRPALTNGIWQGSRRISVKSAEVQDSSLGAWFRFDAKANDQILVKVGISYVSVDNARRNLEAELPHWDFGRVKSDARLAWEHELSRIQIEGGSTSGLTTFYSALYHCLIHPNIVSDVNGEYPLAGHTGTGHYIGRERYSVYSLWDTYRTLHPFLTLVYPERQSAIVNTMVDWSKESGWLPKWELAGNETSMMVGDPAAIVIADSYVKGITDFDVETAYAAMIKPSLRAGQPDALPARPGYHEYLRYGYIPFEQDTTTEWWVWGPASVTLEYCLADWSIAQFATKLGKTGDAQEFLRRSEFYSNLFDPVTKFIRPRRKDGSWLMPFDPMATEGSGSWGGSGGPGYVEGSAWNYSWFVPHDVGGLIKRFGGKDSFVTKLEQCFTNGQFTINNEPDIAYPYLFTYIPGEEHRTQRHVRQIVQTQFGSGPDGLPGNDDCGAISGWFVFSALGFYPACPGSTSYQLGAPLFPKATITLNGRYYADTSVVMERPHSAVTANFKSVQWNGNSLPSFHIEHSQMTRGGTLVFQSR